MAKGRCVSLCTMSISRLMEAKLRNSVPMPPNPPALETAAASSAEVQVPIGARMIGTSMPNIGQSGVVSMVSSPHIHSARETANVSNRAASRHLHYFRHDNTNYYGRRSRFLSPYVNIVTGVARRRDANVSVAKVFAQGRLSVSRLLKNT